MTRKEIQLEFITAERLVKFVLEDCMDLLPTTPSGFGNDYRFDFSDYFRLYIWNKDADIQKIYYLDQLLHTGFNINITFLYINNDVNVLNPEFLIKLDKLLQLKWPQDTDFPELPDTIRLINQNEPTWVDIDKIDFYHDNRLNKQVSLKYHEPNITHREILDRIITGEIRV